MNREQTLGALRNVLSVVMGILVGRGIISAEQAASITNDLLIAGPAIVGLALLVWEIVAKRNKAIITSAGAMPDVQVRVGENAPAGAISAANDINVPNVVTKGP